MFFIRNLCHRRRGHGVPSEMTEVFNMKKKIRIYSLLFLILFNFFSFNIISLKLNLNNVYANPITDFPDNIRVVTDVYKKLYFKTLSSLSGFYTRNEESFENLYNKASFINDNEFVQGAKEFTIRKLFKGKESYKKLVLEEVLSDNQHYKYLFVRNLDRVSAYLNEEYYNYNKKDSYHFGDTSTNFKWEVDKNYTFTYNFPEKAGENYKSGGEYHNGLHYFSDVNYRDSRVSFSLPSSFDDNNILCYHSQIGITKPFNSGRDIQFEKKNYGYSFVNRLNYEVARVYCTLYNSNGDLLKDGYLYVYFGGGVAKASEKFANAFNNSTSKLYERFQKLDLNEYDVGFDNVLYRGSSRTYNYVFNAPNYNYNFNIDNSKNLSEQIDYILGELDKNAEYFKNVTDYINDGTIYDSLNEIGYAVNNNNDIIIDHNYKINELEKEKVDYSDLEDYLKKYEDRIVSKYIEDINDNIDKLGTKVSNLNSDFFTLKAENVKQFKEVKDELEDLHNEIMNMQDNSGSGGKDHDKDFKILNTKLDNMKNDYESNFNNLNKKLDNLDLKNINFNDDEKKSLKDNIFDSFNFLKSIQSFFKNFFTTDEKFEFKKIETDGLSKKIPFSIFSDTIGIIKKLNSTPQIPKFSFTLVTLPIVIDFSKFDTLIKIIRSFTFLFFVFGLMFAFYKKVG